MAICTLVSRESRRLDDDEFRDKMSLLADSMLS